jgi:hypothetical protein
MLERCRQPVREHRPHILFRHGKGFVPVTLLWRRHDSFIHRSLHHRRNRMHRRWCVLHHQRNTGPYSLLSYSYNYNPDCPSAISLNLDQTQSDKLVHGPNFGITVHSGHLCRQHQFPACLFSPERLDQDCES